MAGPLSFRSASFSIAPEARTHMHIAVGYAVAYAHGRLISGSRISPAMSPIGLLMVAYVHQQSLSITISSLPPHSTHTQALTHR